MAIARDGSGVGHGSTFATTMTFSRTVNGPNPILWVHAYCDNSATLTATYNGVSMRNPVNAVRFIAAASYREYLFYITGIAGTFNVVLTGTGSPNVITANSMAFSGASQISGEPDNSGNQEDVGSGAINYALTMTADNAWMVMGNIDQTSGNPTPTGPAVLECNSGTAGLYSQGPYSPAGSNSMQVTPTGTHTVDAVFASFATAGGPTAAQQAGIWAQMAHGGVIGRVDA